MDQEHGSEDRGGQRGQAPRRQPWSCAKLWDGSLQPKEGEVKGQGGASVLLETQALEVWGAVAGAKGLTWRSGLCSDVVLEVRMPLAAVRQGSSPV